MIMGGATLAHLAWVVSVGDDGLTKYRFYVPIVGPVSFLTGLLFYDPGVIALTRAQKRRAERKGLSLDPRSLATPRDQVLAGLGVAAILIAIPMSVSLFHSREGPRSDGIMSRYLEGNIKLGRHLAATRSPDTVIAVAAAGAIPFYSGLPTIDMYGLNDAHIARVPFPEGQRGRMMKWDNAYVLSRSPDLIVINRGYRWHSKPERFSMAPMDRDMANRLRLGSAYSLGTIEFGDGTRFWVYEKTSSGNQ